MKIVLTRGQVAIIDQSDANLVAGYKWYAQRARGGGYYAATTKSKACILMHRVITKARPGWIVDHINHQTLDNRRRNLRVCTYWQNAANMRKKPGTSRYKGVFRHSDGNHWRAAITVEYERIHLGLFKNERKAAMAYRAAAKKYFGRFAYV
jgi:hypothetical protein